MTFQQLKFVMEVLRLGSINKAANYLFIAQSNISSSIKELETELGIEIFKRNNRGVELTDKGREFISYSKPLLEQKEKIEALYSKESSEPAMRFNISSQRYPFAVDGFVRFMKLQNSLKYEYSIKETNMYQIINDVHSNESDVGIIFISDVTEKFIKKVLVMKNIEFHEITKVVPQIFFSSSHPLANSTAVSLNQLTEYPFIMFEQESGVSLDFSEEIALMNFERPNKIIYVHDRATVYNIIANTDAYSIGSGLLPKGYADPRVITKPIAGECEIMKIGWIKLKSKPITTQLENFISCLEKSTKDIALKN